jgi:hypothetical protein
MRARCHRPSDSAFPRYGAKGIRVCKEWHSFSRFLADMGEPEIGMTIDRIDGGGDYEPNNCRWATRKTQNRNRSTARILTCHGARRPVWEWSEITGIGASTIHRRLGLGWSDERAVLTPPRVRHVYSLWTGVPVEDLRREGEAK